MNTKKIKNQAMNNSLSYSGEIDFIVKSKNRIIEERHLKNNGTKYLFNFFCNALANDFSAAVALRPTKVVLYNVNMTATMSISDLKIELDKNTIWENGKIKGTSIEITPLSTQAFEYGNPSHKETDNYTSLHFLIPNTFLFNKDNKKINMACLYASDKNNNEYSAYYLFLNSAGTDFNGIAINSETNFNMEWKLTISNSAN